MPPDAVIEKLEQRLKSEAGQRQLSAAFDMVDSPEVRELLKHSPQLSAASDWLARNLLPKWDSANGQAERMQRQYRFIAHTAISLGALAIVLAVAQLPQVDLFEHAAPVVSTIEVCLAFLAALVGVVGLGLRPDRKWLGNRHRAERLRLLKYEALGSEMLWSSPVGDWEDSVGKAIEALGECSDHDQVEAWALGGEASTKRPVDTPAGVDLRSARMLECYYRFKRLGHQRDYFGRQGTVFENQSRPVKLFGRVLFAIFVISAFVHFGVKVIEIFKLFELPRWAEELGQFALFIAAAVPVINVGVRMWFGAREVPRSASLFRAKGDALAREESRLRASAGDLTATRIVMSDIEHFLEHEHREWLRLLLEAEWLL